MYGVDEENVVEEEKEDVVEVLNLSTGTKKLRKKKKKSAKANKQKKKSEGGAIGAKANAKQKARSLSTILSEMAKERENLGGEDEALNMLDVAMDDFLEVEEVGLSSPGAGAGARASIPTVDSYRRRNLNSDGGLIQLQLGGMTTRQVQQELAAAGGLSIEFEGYHTAAAGKKKSTKKKPH